MSEDTNTQNALAYGKSRYKELLDLYIEKTMPISNYSMDKMLAVSVFWDTEHDTYKGAIDSLYEILMKKLGSSHSLGFTGFPEISKVTDTQYIISCSVAVLDNNETRVLM